jgi:RHS repeat-associated protein
MNRPFPRPFPLRGIDHSQSSAPCYDGSGNITAYIDLASGQVTQRLEYDAFGNELSLDSQLSSSTSTAPSFRFSTKYTDQKTNLLYYGYRYLSPELGRWLSRDPIGERGGVNVNTFSNADMLNRVDGLGLQTLPPGAAGCCKSNAGSWQNGAWVNAQGKARADCAAQQERDGKSCCVMVIHTVSPFDLCNLLEIVTGSSCSVSEGQSCDVLRKQGEIVAPGTKIQYENW